MKKIILTLLTLLTTVTLWAQAPQRISYQSVIRDGNNVVVASTTVGIKISMVRGTATGPAVYVETHRKTTNANGLLSLEIGDGTALTGTFAGIDWANGPYLIKTETDPTGGTNYSIPGIAALNSVPYALFSANGTPGPQGERGLTGATGAAGPQGERGLTGALGATGATGPAGANGTNGANGTSGTNGSNGLDGKTVLNGTSNPATGQGVIGDFYINTATSTLFGPKASGGWPTGVSLVGPTGVTGIQGIQGIQGATGAAGTNAGVGGFTHYLGEAFNGGIIFYLYKGSDGLEHGLIVALTESTAKWQTTSSLVNANRSEDGAYNTNLMTNSPAKDYIVNTLGTGWYLPSIDELALLYYNRYSAQKGLRAGSNTLLKTSDGFLYFSSTEFAASQAAAIDFNSGAVLTNSGKTVSQLVRGVRAF